MIRGPFLVGTNVTWDTLPGKPSAFVPAVHTHTWADITGKPSTFAPSAHTHSISDVTGLQSALDGKQASGSYVTTASFTWANLSGKPTTFAPSAHTHLWADITDKPTTFPPSAHTHSYNDLTDKPVIPTAGRLELIGTLNFSETLLVSLAVGMKRRTVALAGVSASDRLTFVATGAPTAGCEVINVYPASVGNISVGYYTPLLGIGAAYSMPIAVYRITT